MEDGRKQYRSEPIDTSAWLTALLGQFQGELNGHQVALETRLPPALPALRGDRDALSAAVLNLLDNTVKYSPEPATVWFEAECCENSLAIRVRDRGIGIAEEDRPHVFEKFYRGSVGGATAAKGAGIGLALVRHIVTAHDGRVECQSHLGEGSIFVIQLPIVSEHRDKITQPDSLSQNV
jgi:signal transduction histidine kinase